MRKIDTRRARRATRTTSREINESILLNLVREHQPISRAELARRMKITPATVSMLVSELLESGALVEGATGQAARGRKPVMLHIRTHDRYVVAVDVRLSRTTVMLSDLSGRPLAMESFSTQPEPEALVQELAERIPRMLTVNGVKEYEGVGLVVPGMVDRHAGLLLNSPQLGWRDVPLRQALADALGGARVMLENAPIACALAHLWLNPRSREGNQNFVYVAISDGVGAGVVVDGEVLRGSGHTAGEFGHMPINLDGPQCLCGLRGCWEAYTSNVATLARYFHHTGTLAESRELLRRNPFTMSDLIALARSGDAPAREALEETAHYVGIGLAVIVHALSPGRIIVEGEISDAWELVGDQVRSVVSGRALTHAAAATPILPAPPGNTQRLRGGVALQVALDFSPPRIM